MRYYVKGSLEDFKAWSGAVYTLNKLIELNKVSQVESYLECLGDDISETTINDFLWFERDFIFLGLLNYSEDEALELGLI